MTTKGHENFIERGAEAVNCVVQHAQVSYPGRLELREEDPQSVVIDIAPEYVLMMASALAQAYVTGRIDQINDSAGNNEKREVRAKDLGKVVDLALFGVEGETEETLKETKRIFLEQIDLARGSAEEIAETKILVRVKGTDEEAQAIVENLAGRITIEAASDGGEIFIYPVSRFADIA